ncbi:Ig-like domain-containing protein [Solirubrobacter taibaiensis]|nr:Ig-like domain-containing protein [Solirubrobacter taibaiensis]
MKRIMLGLMATLAFAAPAHADNYAVDGDADTGGTCVGTAPNFACPTLRVALTAANANSGPDTVLAQHGLYQLTNGPLQITDAVTLQGDDDDPGIIRADVDGGRVLEITGATAALNDLTLQGGTAPQGGALLAQTSTVTLNRVRVTGGAAESGGGIANRSSTMVINESLIDSNQAAQGDGTGGGIVNLGDAVGGLSTLTINHSTIAANIAKVGGGLVSDGNPQNALFTTGVTIGQNRSTVGAGGVHIGSGAWTPQLTLVSDNLREQIPSNCTGTDASSNGWNLENFDECGFTQDPDKRNVLNARLATSLADNGGPTFTLALLSGSQALNIRTTGCTGTDQRGTSRPQGTGCDAGAFESAGAPSGPPVITTPAPDLYTAVLEQTFAGTADPGAAIEIHLGASLVAMTDANAQGAWTTTIELPAADGAYTYGVSANGSARSTVDLTVDRTRPDTFIDDGPPPVSTSSTAAFTYSSSEPGSTFACRFFGPGHPDTTFGPCPTTGQTYTNLANGEYTFGVTAVDRANNADATPREYTFVVNSATVTAPTPDTYTRATTLQFSGTATPAQNVTVLLGTATAGTALTDGQGVWTTTVDLPPADGEYTYRIDFGDVTKDVRIFVDRTAPAGTITSGPPTGTSGGAVAFTYSKDDPEATFRCRLVGPGRDDNEEECPGAGQSYADLPPGDYEFRLRTVDRAGNGETVVYPFTVAPAPPVVVEQPSPTPSATPDPTPTPRPTEIPAPQPDVGESVVIRPTAGRVFIQLPGSSQLVELRSIGEIPLGATIDTRNGRIQLRFETEDGKVQTATFYGGIFQIRQVGKILDLKLTEALAACPKKGNAAAAQTKKAKKRKLWGDGKGSFRTTGKYSAATVRGTKWLVEDSCAGTLTRVTSGVVAVRAGKKTVLVRAGKQYLAKPR